ncbi:S8 family serine peptidase [Actinomycetes bacterium KLBMP 9797]
MFRSSWRARGAALVALATLPTIAGPVAANAGPVTSGGARTTFWVVLDGAADLSAARTMTGKPARGAAVHSALTTHAQRAQAGLRDLLHRRKAEFEPFWIANVIKVVGDAELRAEVARRPEVARIEPDTRWPPPQPAPAVPGAPSGTVEWNLERVGATRVWHELGVRGEGVVVANIDSGVRYDHPALIDSYRGRHSNGTVNHNYSWLDATGTCPSGTPCDPTGHGTHVMGIEVGRSADGANQIGVAPGARWIAARMCCTQDELLTAGQWMLAPTDLNGANPRPDLAPDVVNNSWYSRDNPGVFFADVLDAWVAAGIFPVFAAGNNGVGGQCRTNTWPPSFPTAYAVGNTDAENQVVPDSSRGPAATGETKPDIAAPGTDVRSSDVTEDYAERDGTSQAAPHVAGAVALLWSAAPALEGDIAATRRILDETARDIDATECGGTADDNNVAGEGLLDVYAAVGAAPRTGVGGLTGRVRRAGSGVAVPDAAISLAGPRTKALSSGADGSYRLDRMMPGTYSYRVTAFGYREASGSLVIDQDRRTVLDLTLRPLPSAVVAGVVRSAEGPAAGTTVAIAGTPVRTRTGADGRYRLVAPLGSHELVAEPPSRCALPAGRAVTVAADVTADLDLPARTDAFGNTCTAPVVGYQAGTTRLDLAGSTGAVREIALPFPVTLYGTTFRTAWVSTNGAIGLDGPPDPITFDWLDPLPNLIPNTALYPFSTLLDVDDAAGVYTTVTAEQVVVEWRDVMVLRPGSRAPTGRISVSVTIRPDGTATFQYRDVAAGPWPEGRNAVVGIQDATGSDAFAFASLERVVTSGLGFTIHPPLPSRGRVEPAGGVAALAHRRGRCPRLAFWCHHPGGREDRDDYARCSITCPR